MKLKKKRIIATNIAYNSYCIIFILILSILLLFLCFCRFKKSSNQNCLQENNQIRISKKDRPTLLNTQFFTAMPEKLPDNVTSLLKSTRFVHLATCLNDIPHVTLMNYTYYHKDQVDMIILTTPKDSIKYENMINNPNVSLLVHDWISAQASEKPQGERRNSLYELLANLNKNEISRVSVMLTGKAEYVDHDSESHEFYISLHQNNSKIDQVQAENYIKCADNALFVIKIDSCKVTDTNNKVEEYQGL